MICYPQTTFQTSSNRIDFERVKVWRRLSTGRAADL